MGQRLECEALPRRRHLAGLGQRLPGLFHQVAVRHRRRTRRLAPAALHARFERAHHLVGEWSVVVLHLTHERDPAPGRHRLVAGDPVRGAVRQTQPALHARVEFVGVELEVHRRLPTSGPGVRPGLSRPVGSKCSFIRSCIARTECDGEHVAVAATSANTVPIPIDATKPGVVRRCMRQRRRGSVGGAQRPSVRPGSSGGPSTVVTSHRPPRARAVRRRHRQGGLRARPRCALPSHSTALGARRASSTANGSTSSSVEPFGCGGNRIGPENHLARSSRACRAIRPSAGAGRIR